MITAQPSRQDLDTQVQGLPLTGFALPHMATIILEVVDAPKARLFIRKLLDEALVNFGGQSGKSLPPRAVSIGLTYEGLRALETPTRVLQALATKSPAYAEGPPSRAARYLGDAGASAAERWDKVFRRKSAHVWIAIHAASHGQMQEARDRLRRLAGAKGLSGWDRKDSVPDAAYLSAKWTYADAKERSVAVVHFGYRDNITKPSIIDENRMPFPPPTGMREAKKPQPGELLVGYANNDKADVWTAAADPDVVDCLRNGSFGVLRLIEQNEAVFRAYLQAQVEFLRNERGVAVTTEYLQAKLCGRWPNGAPVQPDMTAPSSDWNGEDGPLDFSGDKEGTGCPFGAHVRRANPRSEVMPPRDRTLFRRGMPYGPRYDEKPDAKRGLVGIFFCCRIEDQFELLVSEWLEKNPLGPPTKGRAKDPFSGHHDEPEARFHIPLKDGGGILLQGFETFVRTRGTLYALFPSQRALEMIASGRFGSAL